MIDSDSGSWLFATTLGDSDSNSDSDSDSASLLLLNEIIPVVVD